MKYLLGSLICSVALALASAPPLFAGVVMAETSTANGPDGRTNSQVKTIYLQGNKQRVERRDVAAITDLDKGIIYIVDKQHREYAQVPLSALSPSPRANGVGPSIKLDRTSNIRTVANHPCREYRASEGDTLERVTIRACVSTDAPGAKEISQFDRKMIARLGGQDSQRSPAQEADALMLDKQSVVSFRIPDPAQHRPYRIASLSTETRVKQIQLKPLSPETFRPPKGFNELRNRPQQTAPRISPQDAGNTFKVIALNSAGSDRPARL